MNTVYHLRNWLSIGIGEFVLLCVVRNADKREFPRVPMLENRATASQLRESAINGAVGWLRQTAIMYAALKLVQRIDSLELPKIHQS